MILDVVVMTGDSSGDTDGDEKNGSNSVRPTRDEKPEKQKRAAKDKPTLLAARIESDE